jgi:hypothetical protein
MPEPEYSLEVIRRYREMKAEHAFYRGIKERRPAWRRICWFWPAGLKER